MNSKYSIKDLEQLSGIKANTIRIWEQRYAVIQPRRTDTNIRYYEDCDLRKLLNVSFLVHEGIKISKVTQLSEDEMHQLVQEKSGAKGCFSAEINALKMAMFEYDQFAFTKAFETCVEKYGTEKAFTDVLGEFIAQLGVLWQTNTISVSNEHFVSNLIKQKLYSLIDATRVAPKQKAKTFLLYLPSNELHEIGLLYLQYQLLLNGQHVIFLGQNTPSDYLFEVYKKSPFDEVISIFTTYPHCEDVAEYIDNLVGSMNDYPVKFNFCGSQVHKLLDNEYENSRVKLFKGLSELKESVFNK